MLTAKTIWGDVSWAEVTRGAAVDLLQQGYPRIKKVGELMSRTANATLNQGVYCKSNVKCNH